jgi:hypothetical protein
VGTERGLASAATPIAAAPLTDKLLKDEEGLLVDLSKCLLSVAAYRPGGGSMEVFSRRFVGRIGVISKL